MVQFTSGKLHSFVYEQFCNGIINNSTTFSIESMTLTMNNCCFFVEQVSCVQRLESIEKSYLVPKRRIIQTYICWIHFSLHIDPCTVVIGPTNNSGTIRANFPSIPTSTMNIVYF